MPLGPEIEDSALLRRAQAGEAEAFGTLYERHAKVIYRFLYAHTDSRLEAEDLTEEVFLRAWRSIATYRENGIPFLAFLFRVARNLLIDHYRRNGHAKQNIPIEDQDGQIIFPDPHDPLAVNLERQELKDALKQLRGDYRDVLVLRFLNELTPEETARAMGRSAGAIRTLQHRALAALRSLLETM